MRWMAADLELAAADVGMLCALLVMVFAIGSVVMLVLPGRRGKHRDDIETSTWRRSIDWVRDTYTLKRWLTNPFKMSMVALLWQANFQQLLLTGPATSLIGELDYGGRLYLTVGNLIGACIGFYALHLKDTELSLWIEFWSYISLIGTLGIWVVLVYMDVSLPNTSYGLNLVEGFLIGCLIRSGQILRYKRAQRKDYVRQQAELFVKLDGDDLGRG